MDIGITGAGGFIGKKLTKKLISKGFNVMALSRGFTKEQVEHCDTIINLAGATINQRWSKKNKKAILESRVDTTKRLCRFIKESGRVKHLISASATGIYLANPNIKHTENDYTEGTGFLSDVCRAWENETKCLEGNKKLTITRLGVVLDPTGGALKQMILPFKMKVCTILGDGNQFLSWISMEDLLEAYLFIIENQITGTVNMCAPYPITNKEISSRISDRYKPIVKISIPSLLIKLTMGEASKILLDSTYVTSKVLDNKSFLFKTPKFTL